MYLTLDRQGEQPIMTVTKPDAGLWDAERVAAELGISKQHIYRLVRHNRIPFVRIDRLVRFHPDKIHAWVETRSVPAAAK
jgi:excisionase family DNA binding protein